MNEMIHAGHIEYAVAMLLNYRVYTIVPNVSHGLYLNHECDMLALKDGKFTEIEIKISLSDLKADFKKKHGHRASFITRLIYAFPESIAEKAIPLIPMDCGIIIVKTLNRDGMLPKYYAKWHRKCRHRKLEKPIPNDIYTKFYKLGCMRIWSLKFHNNNKNRPTV